VEDEGPDPVLDPDVDSHVRALLASIPDPGAMPERFAGRIEAALREEARLKVDPGPLTSDELDNAVLAPLLRQRQRPRPLLAAAAVAAAAAVVAVGGSALHLSKRANGEASLGDPSAVVTTPGRPSVSATAPTPTGASPASSASSSDPNLHIQLSRTAYDAANLPVRARALLTKPDAPVQVLAAEAPLLGPIATPTGLTSCLRELGVPLGSVVHTDLATYEGRPVAVIVVSAGPGGDTAWVVRRSCTTGAPAIVQGAIPVP
jgi:hypothetical protein